MLPVLLNGNKHTHILKRRWGRVGLHRVNKIKYICVSKPKKEILVDISHQGCQKWSSQFRAKEL